jgi:hypothetical protein
MFRPEKLTCVRHSDPPDSGDTEHRLRVVVAPVRKPSTGIVRAAPPFDCVALLADRDVYRYS